MLVVSDHLKMFIVSILLLKIFMVKSDTITVDYNKCEKVNLLSVAAIVVNPQFRYYLFTSDDPLVGEEIKDQNISSVEESKFNKDLPTRIFISGWKTTPQNCRTALIKDAYLKYTKVNFILADWYDWNKREYPVVAPMINDIGKLLGKFTMFLNSKIGVKFSDIILIGHSLGAHLAGAAGSAIKPNKFKTIYGLDPSGPGFIGASPSYRLDPDDAEYVEVISTDMFFYGYGSNTPAGHAVFYPNNGVRIQPFCPSSLTSNMSDMLCSHASAVDLFANTLNSELQFCGIETTWYDVLLRRVQTNNDNACNIVMGGEPSVPKKGHYYVFVSNSGPLPG